MKAPIYTAPRKGFTLLELIIVIAILAGLASIAFPVIMGAMDTAKASAANKQCADIAAGIDNFKDDYSGLMPFRGEDITLDEKGQLFLTTSEGRDAGILAVLTNREPQDEEDRLNTNSKVYLNSDLKDKPADGLYANSAGELSLYDPWGKPYYIVICEENEGCNDPFTGNSTRKLTLVYSLGSDGEGIAPCHRDAPKSSS